MQEINSKETIPILQDGSNEEFTLNPHNLGTIPPKDDQIDFSFNFTKRHSINYAEFDHQKGSMSPRLLFKKRKSDPGFDQQKQFYEYKADNNIKVASKLKDSFEYLMDFVHDTYFAPEPSHEINHNIKYNNEESSFKFTSLDLLINPLRQKFTWEMWSPYEIALFHCCVCKFGLNFDIFHKIIKTKTKEEIIDFYLYWKSSKYYKVWKSNRHKKNKKLYQNI